MTAKIATVIAGFIAGGAIVTGTAVALDRTQAASRQSPAIAPMTMSGTMMRATGSSTATTKLVIQHVQKGCHVWRNGSIQSTSTSVSFKRGTRLQVVNQDIDPHRLVQLAGPNLALREHMMMGQTQLITFRQPGVYRFKNKVVEMGPEMSVETMGPDNTLRLTVSVR